MDFADFRLPWGKRHALIVVLGYSRRMWLRFYERQTMPVVMRGLEAAFTYFGGVPSELLFDQMKAVCQWASFTRTASSRIRRTAWQKQGSVFPNPYGTTAQARRRRSS